MLVSAENGSCAAFRCPFHFWTYSLEGELVGIPGEEAYDGTGLEKENFPLLEVACDSVLGLVFVSLATKPDSLEDWLGPEVIEVLNTPLANNNLEVFRNSSIDIPVNWKVWAENS